MEVDLLTRITAQQPDRSERLAVRRTLTESQRVELGQFEEEYFDGPTGYGGYYYDGRHALAVRKMIERYELSADSRVLDIGCAKGFMLYEFLRAGIEGVCGCDVSRYAIAHAHPEIKDRLEVMSADQLGFPDGAFDLVYSIDVIHNLAPADCDRAIKEIMRVSRRAKFIQVVSFETAAEEHRLREWGVTVKTIRSKETWREAFGRLGYQGDYYLKTF
ncbi:MAG: class I SAM-dependent methyltransferase [Planctomycetes bacterium]|nr:class I SAM-dependent methyltransferase [Planctomycetota bacterium]